MKKQKSALSIVAHPDDETIWMGGFILRNNHLKWTIISLCRKDDPDREPKFMKVCENYSAEGIISDLDDEVLKPLEIKEVEDKILEALPSKEYDLIFTHGDNGEYGHIRHKETHKAVTSLVDSGDLKCDELYFFSYDRDNVDEIPEPKPSDLKIELSDSELNEKTSIVTDLYGFQKDSFEALSCSKKECFSER